MHSDYRVFFFFQAEDGIRDGHVTGVQTCALPILMVGDQDVFVNVVGGLRVMETSADLALLLAIVSSFRDRPLAQDLMVFGEVGLSGEIRPVPSGQERLREAVKHGFKRAIVPKGNAPREAPPGVVVVAVKNLAEALDAIGS